MQQLLESVRIRRTENKPSNKAMNWVLEYERERIAACRPAITATGTHITYGITQWQKQKSKRHLDHIGPGTRLYERRTSDGEGQKRGVTDELRLWNVRTYSFKAHAFLYIRQNALLILSWNINECTLTDWSCTVYINN